MPDYRLFGLALILIGASAQTFTTGTTSTVQLSTEPAMRGRVLAILLAIAAAGIDLVATVALVVIDRITCEA